MFGFGLKFQASFNFVWRSPPYACIRPKEYIKILSCVWHFFSQTNGWVIVKSMRLQVSTSRNAEYWTRIGLNWIYTFSKECEAQTFDCRNKKRNTLLGLFQGRFHKSFFVWNFDDFSTKSVLVLHFSSSTFPWLTNCHNKLKLTRWARTRSCSDVFARPLWLTYDGYVGSWCF